ncbi:MAG: hypothetical protein IPL92_01275 [Saprospiraceae bacterium]|nr:hypothetical protein [Candidatus Opimibacter iunctus]
MSLDNLTPALIITLIMALLYAASKKKPRDAEDGSFILQLPKFYAWFGLFVIIGGFALVIYTFIYASESDKLLGALASIIALIVGMWIFAKGYISQIRVTDSGLIETTIFGKEKTILWGEITKVSFGTISMELTIRSAEKKIKAHLHMVGFNGLVYKLESKTRKSRFDLGIPGF